MNSRVRFPLLVVAGLMILQTAWIITVPPYRGIDEFDHVYRAASVAEGQWRPQVAARNGRGLEVTIPKGIVTAASGQCEALDYTKPGNCHPIRLEDGGRVVVATAAGAYIPVYYASVAPAARLFKGPAVVYAMRGMTALLMALGVGLAAYCLALAGARRWTRFGLLVGMTPVFVYSTILPAPNGLEMVAGLCLWASMVALLADGAERRRDGLLLGIATVSGSLLAVTRMLGPMWLGFIVLTILVWFGWPRAWEVIRRRPRAMFAAALLIAASSATNVWWMMSTRVTGTSSDVASDAPVKLGAQPVVWVLQIIGAFPTRTEPAHPAVYVTYMSVFVALTVAALLVATPRARIVLGLMAATIVLLPIAISLATVGTHGLIWQGRYGLAFAMGLPLLAGLALDRRSTRQQASPALYMGCALLTVAHGWSVIGVRLGENVNQVSLANDAWLAPSPIALGALVVLGCGVIVVALMNTHPRGYPSEPLETHDVHPLDHSIDGGLRQSSPGSVRRGPDEHRAANPSAR